MWHFARLAGFRQPAAAARHTPHMCATCAAAAWFVLLCAAGLPRPRSVPFVTLPAPRLPTPECLMTALQQGGNSPCLPGSCCVPWGVASLRASQRLAAGLSSSCGRWPGHTGHTCTPTLLVSCNQGVCPAGGVCCTCGTFGRVWVLFCIGWRQCSCAQIRWNSLGTQWCKWRHPSSATPFRRGFSNVEFSLCRHTHM